MDESYCPGCGVMGEDSECKPDCERAPKEIVREPYSYTLPEKFLTDQEVPARWRVWAVINGFFINTGSCWASNEWISKRIGAHKDTVSQAVKELEEMKVISCKRGARSRLIYPMIGVSTYLDRQRHLPHDRHQRLSNSVSDSVNKIPSELEDEIRVVEVSFFEGEEKVARKPAKYPHAKEVFAEFPSPQKSWLLNKTQRAHAELIWEERQMTALRGIIAFCKSHQNDDFFPAWETPYDLERNWSKIIKFAERNGL